MNSSKTATVSTSVSYRANRAKRIAAAKKLASLPVTAANEKALVKAVSGENKKVTVPVNLPVAKIVEVKVAALAPAPVAKTVAKPVNLRGAIYSGNGVATASGTVAIYRVAGKSWGVKVNGVEIAKNTTESAAYSFAKALYTGAAKGIAAAKAALA